MPGVDCADVLLIEGNDVRSVDSAFGMAALILVARAGIEPATFRFSGGRSYRLSYLAGSTVSNPSASPQKWRP
jgi:hypothetical protein